MTRPRLARRSIPVAIAAPVQLPLGLVWTHPIDRVLAMPEPERPAPVAVPVARKAAA